ncbi:hypothetical protein AAFF_G00371740 [Aldrovandia affinis]|uniref:Uncharacterized protein n=1 Tax=Aldrovandia affinis TaxID=143900 RepID=A0AAD7SGV1_9TELE|nr:hypothetical protein AAFF_G00371740 [Aldrovandia affinis]
MRDDIYASHIPLIMVLFVEWMPPPPVLVWISNPADCCRPRLFWVMLGWGRRGEGDHQMEPCSLPTLPGRHGAMRETLPHGEAGRETPGSPPSRDGPCPCERARAHRGRAVTERRGNVPRKTSKQPERRPNGRRDAPKRPEMSRMVKSGFFSACQLLLFLSVLLSAPGIADQARTPGRHRNKGGKWRTACEWTASEAGCALTPSEGFMYSRSLLAFSAIPRKRCFQPGSGTFTRPWLEIMPGWVDFPGGRTLLGVGGRRGCREGVNRTKPGDNGVNLKEVIASSSGAPLSHRQALHGNEEEGGDHRAPELIKTGEREPPRRPSSHPPTLCGDLRETTWEGSDAGGSSSEAGSTLGHVDLRRGA